MSEQATGGVGVEGAPEYAAVRELPVEDLLRRLRAGVGLIDHRVFDLSDEQSNQAFMPEAGVGRWSCRVLLGHMADADMVYAHRIRRVVAEENPVLTVFDEDAFIDSGIYGDREGSAPTAMGAFVAVMYTMREWMGIWLAGVDAGAWERKAMHPEHGEMTLRDLVSYMVFHLERHAWFLNRKVEKFLGPMPEQECCGESPDASGCGGPGCCKNG